MAEPTKPDEAVLTRSVRNGILSASGILLAGWFVFVIADMAVKSSISQPRPESGSAVAVDTAAVRRWVASSKLIEEFRQGRIVSEIGATPHAVYAVVGDQFLSMGGDLRAQSMNRLGRELRSKTSARTFVVYGPNDQALLGTWSWGGYRPSN